LGPYEILSAIGAGGMGEVYQARDTCLGRTVAIKVLPVGASADPARRLRFEQEARAVSTLNHPHICVLHDIGREGDTEYLVMEYLDGQTLAQRLRKGALPLAQVLDLGAQIADALATAHRHGIVHRDLQPVNIMLTKAGAKLLDFGLAKLKPPPLAAGVEVSELSTQAPATRAGTVMGTVPYMAPEQLEGKETDARTDLFAFGCVLYEMLTARRAFGGDTEASVISAIMSGEPAPLSSLQPLTPPALDRLVRRCLAKDPDDRWQHAADVAEELRGISQDAVATDGVRAAMPRRSRRLVWALAAGAAALLALGLVAGLQFVHFRATPPPPFRLTLSFPVPPAAEALVTDNLNPLALSPDGRTLVYVGGGANSIYHLFVRRLDRGEIRQIPGTDWTVSAFFSPNGLGVGFFTADGKLKKVALAGGAPTVLCDAPNARGGAWGPDGTIVFTPAMKSGLWRVPAATGGEPRVVTTPTAGTVARHIYPHFLPDGDHVLFTLVDPPRPTRAAVVSLRTGEQRILVERASDARYLPSGHIVFMRAGLLFAVPFDLQRLEVTGAPVQVLDDVVTNLQGLGLPEYAVSQDGTLVYVPSRQLQRTLVWVDRRGAVEPLPFTSAGYQQVALSPKGERVATITIDQHETQALLIGDIARGTLSRSPAEGRFDSVVWTPDGTRVAMGFGPARKATGAFWQNADLSTPPERLTSDTNLQQEWPNSFSPDGRWLLVDVYNFNAPVSSNTLNDLFVLSLIGARTLRPLLQTKAYKDAGQFSPDGHYVAYQSDESDASKLPDVSVRPFPGPGPRWQVSTDGGGLPLWSPSGRELFYWKDDKLMVVDVDGTTPTFRTGQPRVLFQGRFYQQGTNVYAVAPPDGSRFLMIKADPAESGEAHVNVVTNWFEEVKAKVAAAKR
jgi:serine/threonine-protein kinase